MRNLSSYIIVYSIWSSVNRDQNNALTATKGRFWTEPSVDLETFSDFHRICYGNGRERLDPTFVSTVNSFGGMGTLWSSKSPVCFFANYQVAFDHPDCAGRPARRVFPIDVRAITSHPSCRILRKAPLQANPLSANSLFMTSVILR